MVAKSFQTFTQICDPYEKNGRMYVDVINPSTGSKRSVRWYSDYEYAKLYPEDAIKHTANKSYSQKEALGFQKGYVTIFKGDTYSQLDWFHAKKECRYCVFWGWYVVSTEEVPNDIPEGITPITINWVDVGQDNGYLKPETLIKNYIDSLLYEPSDSEWIGEIGDRIEIEVTIKKAIALETNWGGILHVMEDEKGNIYTWSTTSKNWPEGTTKRIRATVKAHNTFRNEKQTNLTRCIER